MFEAHSLTNIQWPEINTGEAEADPFDPANWEED